MLLYLESDLDSAWHMDCKLKTKQDNPWMEREKFRYIYEELVEFHINKAITNHEIDDNIPDWIREAVESTLEEFEIIID
tara:strand:- start:217 stop:453 length:237 start_codon:yes stop_codon:yes gene_type:complete